MIFFFKATHAHETLYFKTILRCHSILLLRGVTRRHDIVHTAKSAPHIVFRRLKGWVVLVEGYIHIPPLYMVLLSEVGVG